MELSISGSTLRITLGFGPSRYKVPTLDLVSKPARPGNTKGGSLTVLLTSCLTGLDKSVLKIKTKRQLSYS
jgi:hypothetical protein